MGFREKIMNTLDENKDIEIIDVVNKSGLFQSVDAKNNPVCSLCAVPVPMNEGQGSICSICENEVDFILGKTVMDYFDDLSEAA